MNRLTITVMALLGVTLTVAPLPRPIPGSVSQAAEQDTIRPDLGKPLQATQEALKNKKYAEALDRLKAVESIPNPSPYEIQVTQQLTLAAAAGGGEPATAAKAYATLAATGRVPAADLLRYQLVLTSAYYQSKDYSDAASWGKRYLKEGGTNPDAITLVAQSYYLAEDYPSGSKFIQEQIKQQDKPSEILLRLLADIYAKQHDTANALKIQELLLTYYSKPEYWKIVLNQLPAQPGFADRLSLDVGRIRLSLDDVSSAEEYLNLAELALQAGLPGEARAIIAQGYTKGILGIGADASRHQRLKDLAANKSSEDQNSLPKLEAESLTSHDGNALVATGLDYLGYGQAEKAAVLIEKGIGKGGLKYPNDALLHYGIALLKSGKTDKANDVLNSINGSDGAADLARLWIIKSQKV